MDTPYRSDAGLARTVLGPLVWPRTYANLLYLLLGFPIGLLYFVVYVTGLSLGLGLLVIGVGVPILVGLVLAARGLARLERGLATALLGVEMPPPEPEPDPGPDGWGRWIDRLTDPATWRGLVFVAIVRFPLGLACWVAAVVLTSVVTSLLFAPLAPLFGGEIDLFWWQPTSLGELAAVSGAGLLLLVPAVHIVNGLGWIWGRIAQALLRPGRATAAAGPTPEPEPLAA